jgi:hypothetical protein
MATCQDKNATLKEEYKNAMTFIENHVKEND